MWPRILFQKTRATVSANSRYRGRSFRESGALGTPARRRPKCKQLHLRTCQRARSTARGVGVYTPVGAEGAYIDILPSDFELLPQRGDGFGERLAFATADLFQCGFGSVCLIDSDSPTVSADVYADAVEILSKAGDRVVLGPSDDGGYYLIGLKQTRRELFERIDWSTERVLDQTKTRARELNLDVSLLRTGYDVDDAATLRRLCDELLSKSSDAEIAPNTRKFLASLTGRVKL